MKRLTDLTTAVLAASRARGAARDHLANPDAPGARFVPLSDSGELDTWFSRSHQHSVTLFLHDPSCPISAHAFRQMAHVAAEIALVDVSSSRDITRSIEQRTGVRHESPQVLVLRDGQAVWSASHYGITTIAVEAPQQHAAGDVPEA